MASRPSSMVDLDQFQRLFTVGRVGGLTDSELLERFVTGQGEEGKAAFEFLVERHGPMVLRVCTQALERSSLGRRCISGHVSGAGTTGRFDPKSRFGGKLAVRGRAAGGQADTDGGGPSSRARTPEAREQSPGSWTQEPDIGRALARASCGDRAASGEVPGSHRALLPGGIDTRAGRQPASLAGGHGEDSAHAWPGAPALPLEPGSIDLLGHSSPGSHEFDQSGRVTFRYGFQSRSVRLVRGNGHQ